MESAFALPILLMFLMALIDFGIWALNANQAENAARDGARAGILAYSTADAASGPDRDVIVAAVLAHLPASTAESAAVVITCVDSYGAVRPCSTARLDTDRIRVEVSWTWPMLSPLAGTVGSGAGGVSGTASMVLIGLPSETTAATTTTTTAT